MEKLAEAAKRIGNGKDAQKERLAQQDVRDLWQTVCLAKEMEIGLGRRALLLGSVSHK